MFPPVPVLNVPLFSHIPDVETINTIGDASGNLGIGMQKLLCPGLTLVNVSVVFEKLNAGQSVLGRDAMLKAIQEMSDELGRRGATGELCLLDIVTAYYPKDRVPVKAQHLVEGLFAEGKI